MGAIELLHIVNGDVTRDLLAAAGLPGKVVVWADVLHEGPVRPDFSDDARAVRTRFIASSGWGSEEEVASTLARWDEGVAQAANATETVLWLEHDLFDQLLLIRHLALLGEMQRADARASLVCIGSFPGHPRFHGLGQLRPAELATLYPARRPVTRRMVEYAAAAWRAFTGADPRALEPFTAPDSDFPFLGTAVTRLLEEYPAIGDGLARTERQILRRLADGAVAAGDLFRQVQLDEEHVFMGDTTFATRVGVLANGARPLVHASSADIGPTTVLELTDDGRSVLGGALDWAALDPFDRHIGGVHLQGASPRWRWDRAAGCIVDSAPD